MKKNGLFLAVAFLSLLVLPLHAQAVKKMAVGGALVLTLKSVAKVAIGATACVHGYHLASPAVRYWRHGTGSISWRLKQTGVPASVLAAGGLVLCDGLRECVNLRYIQLV